MAPAVVLSPHPAGALGLAPELHGTGRVVAWVNPEVLARLRALFPVKQEKAATP